MKAKVKIMRCEGLGCDEKNLGCYILINKELIDVITPLIPLDAASESSSHDVGRLEIPCEGELKLILKMMNGDPLYMGSATVSIQSLPAKGFVWLPLSQSIDNDAVHNIGGTFPNPRILLSISKTSAPTDNSMLYKLQIKKLEFLVKQLESRVADSNKFYDQEKESRANLAQAYESLKTKYDEYVEKSQIREISMLKLLEKKDKELQENIAKNCDLNNRFQTLSLEKSVLQDTIQQLKNSKTDDLTAKMTREIQELETTVTSLRSKETELTDKLQNLGKDWLEATKALGLCGDFNKEDVKSAEHITEINLKAQILELTESNRILKQKLYKASEEKENLSSKLFEIEEIKCQQNSTYIDTKEPDLETTIIEQGVQELLDKTSDGYYFNSQKLNLSVERGKIVVKSLPLEEFLQVSLTSGFDKSILVENRH